MSLSKILGIIIIYSLLATLFGILNLFEGNFSEISWAFIPLGIFIWGDALVLGPFLFLGSIILLRKQNIVWAGLFFSSYASIRSFIEILYNLNGQFSEVKRPWEYWWRELSTIPLEPSERLVLFQIYWTCLFVVSFLSFIYFLKRYFKSK